MQLGSGLRRICWGCGQSWPLTPAHFEIVRRTRVKAYYRNWCRACYQKRRSELPSHALIVEYNARYYSAHREAVLRQAKRRELSKAYARLGKAACGVSRHWNTSDRRSFCFPGTAFGDVQHRLPADAIHRSDLTVAQIASQY